MDVRGVAGPNGRGGSIAGADCCWRIVRGNGVGLVSQIGAWVSWRMVLPHSGTHIELRPACRSDLRTPYVLAASGSGHDCGPWDLHAEQASAVWPSARMDIGWFCGADAGGTDRATQPRLRLGVCDLAGYRQQASERRARSQQPRGRLGARGQGWGGYRAVRA